MIQSEKAAYCNYLGNNSGKKHQRMLKLGSSLLGNKVSPHQKLITDKRKNCNFTRKTSTVTS